MIRLKGKKIILRAVEPSDAQLIFEWENDEKNWSLSNTLVPFSKAIIEQYVETAHKDIFETKQLRLMIDDLSSLSTVGSIDLFDFDPYNLRAGVGILINNLNDRQKGFAKESLEILKMYAQNTLALKQLYCNIGASNLASMALFESCGFVKTGVQHQWQRLTPTKWEDVFFYQLIF